MKKLVILSLLSFLVFLGCNQDSEVTSPVNNSTNQQLKLISLPTPSGGLSVETLFTEVKEINGDNGGYFIATYSYQGGPFGEVNCLSYLRFLPGAFTGDEDITQTLDSETAAMTFGPSKQFNMPIKLTLKFVGLDLSNVNPATLDFVYIALDGTLQNCEYDSIQMNAASGFIIVRNANLNHFSRYGFVN